MGKHIPEVTRYIAAAAPFARPILTEIRERVHAACPDVEEAIKWGHPHFLYHGLMANMAAFSAHAAFGFWKGTLVLEGERDASAMGHFGRLETMRDLPSKKDMQRLIKTAMQLNEAGVPAPRVVRSRAEKPVVIPPALAEALAAAPDAQTAFEAMSPSHRREYCEWIAEAKRAPTVATRVDKTIAQLLERKSLNWKYERTP